MSDINELRNSFHNNNWKKFLWSIKITNLHGWNGETVKFNFPICAIVGENGIGKSTFLKAAASAYENDGMKTFYPSKFFLKTPWDNNSINGAEMECDIQEGDKHRIVKWRKKKDWGVTPKSKRPKRRVYFFDVSRTLPLDAAAGYAKIAKQPWVEKKGTDTHLKNVGDLSYVLGKKYEEGRFIHPNESKKVGLLKSSVGEISQFHQGAGEDATFDLLSILDSIPEQSLLIIDEVEASLHPLAQRRLVKFLIEKAKKDKIQIILSTHSVFVLEELPLESRILLLQLDDRKEVLYNVSSQFALSSIDEVIQPELFVFVEDETAKRLVEEIIRTNDNDNNILKRLSIKPIGDCCTVNTIGKLLKEKKLPYNGLAIVDGDKFEDYKDHCLGIPGTEAPEKVIMKQLQEKEWCNLTSRFGMGAGSLFKILNDSMINQDHHEWMEYIGDHIRRSKDDVWGVLVEEWCKQCMKKEDGARIVSVIKKELDVSKSRNAQLHLAEY